MTYAMFSVQGTDRAIERGRGKFLPPECLPYGAAGKEPISPGKEMFAPVS